MLDQSKLDTSAGEGPNSMKVIRPGEDEAPLRTRRSEGESAGLPAAIVRLAALAAAFTIALVLAVLFGN